MTGKFREEAGFVIDLYVILPMRFACPPVPPPSPTHGTVVAGPLSVEISQGLGLG